MKKIYSLRIIFLNSLLFIFISTFYILSLSKPIYAFDIDFSGLTEEQLNLSEGILKLLKEEEEYIDLQNILQSSNENGSDILSRSIWSNVFEILDDTSSDDKYGLLYDKIHSFFREKNLSFYNANSFEQVFLKEKIEYFNDYNHYTDHSVTVSIITNENKEEIYKNIQKKYSGTHNGDYYIDHRYLLDNNLVGMVEGNDEKLKHEFIVVGINLTRLPHYMYESPRVSILNQALTTTIFLNIIQNVLNHKNKLKRSVLFVSFSNDTLPLSSSFAFIRSHRFLNRFQNGASAFLDYFYYYNDKRSKDYGKHSIYAFINIEQLLYKLFLVDRKYIPLDLNSSSSPYLNRSLLRPTIGDMNSLFYTTVNSLNHTTNNETLDTIFNTILSIINTNSTKDTTKQHTSTTSSLTYGSFVNRGINTLMFGSDPSSFFLDLKITRKQQDALRKYLDPSKIEDFIKAAFINIVYLSMKNSDLSSSSTKNPCSMFFEYD